MKKIISLVLLVGTIVFSSTFAEDTNRVASSCEAEISIRIKDPAKEIKTNEPVILIVQIQNVSTNAMLMFRTESLPTDYTWTISSPSGKDLSSKPDLLPEAISGSFPKLKPLESRETDYDLNQVCNFNEAGIYKVIVKKEVFSISPERKKCEIISNPLNIVISK
jgi:hypothetical protein